VSESNHAVVERYYESVDDNDVDSLVALFADNAVYERPGYEPLRGRDAIERFYRADRVIASGRHTLHNVIAAGDEIAVEGSFAGVLRDGTSVEVRFADFFRLRDGRFQQRHTYFFAASV